MTTLKEKLIKIGAKVVSHGRYVAFQMAEVAIPKNLFAGIFSSRNCDRRPMRRPRKAFVCHASRQTHRRTVSK
jgi:hypothetical protein